MSQAIFFLSGLATTTTNITMAQLFSTPSLPRAIPFIRVVDDDKCTYEVCEEACEILEKMTKPFGVISIVGKYRTGKSFFLNKCLLSSSPVNLPANKLQCGPAKKSLEKSQAAPQSSSSGFSVGNTVQACTKGLWIYTDPVTCAGQMPIFVLDTEGIGALDANNTHDTRIFSMALLLSSFFIYNSLNAIDEDAVNQLSLVTNVCKQIKLSADSETTPEELGREIFPPLLWMVRDFSLKLKDSFGNEISSSEYLETALRDVNNSGSNTATASTSASATIMSDTISDKNRVRRCIRECFPRRQCATLIRPCNDEHELQAMSVSTTNNSALKPLFCQQIECIRRYIVSTIQPKTSMVSKKQVPMTGKSLVLYATAIVNAINAGSAPVIRDAWSLMIEIHYRDAVRDAVAACKLRLREMDPTEVDCEGRLANWDEACAAAVASFSANCTFMDNTSPDFLVWKKTLLAQLEDERQLLAAEVARHRQSTVLARITEIDAFFAIELQNGTVVAASQPTTNKQLSITEFFSENIDRLEKDFRTALAELDGSCSGGGSNNSDKLVQQSTTKTCKCFAKTALRQLSDKCWTWIKATQRVLVETLLDNDSSATAATVSSVQTEWMRKCEQLQTAHQQAVSEEHKKFEDLQTRLMTLNSQLADAMAEKETELALLKCTVAEQNDLIRRFQEYDNDDDNALGLPEDSARPLLKDSVRPLPEDSVRPLPEDSVRPLPEESSNREYCHEQFLTTIQSIRSECSEAIEATKQEYRRKAEEQESHCDTLLRQKKKLEDLVAAKENNIKAMSDKLATLRADYQHQSSAMAALFENYKTGWDEVNVRLSNEIASIQQQRLCEQLEWAEKVRAAETKAVIADTQWRDCKRKLEQLSDPARMKRLKIENNLLRQSIAKHESQADWMQCNLAKLQESLTTTRTANDELTSKFHALQRDKEKEILTLTLTYEKQLSSCGVIRKRRELD